MTTGLVGNRRDLERLAGGGYVYTLVDDAVRIEFRHMRRHFQQLRAEVDVRCDWMGAQTTSTGSLSCADLNLSSQSDRSARAKYCAARAKTRPGDFDWDGAFDDACCRVIQAERDGVNAIVLDDAPLEGPPKDFTVYGLSIPADSHSQVITDGGGMKSLLLLLVLGSMARAGMVVAYLDWEWNASRHLARKRRLFGDERLDSLFYLRCQNPITVEQDHIRRFCDQERVDFIAIDSISAACDGKLADDDVARAYNRALDGLPPSLAAAHVPKSAMTDPAADLKAFGSAFFHNFSRMTWSVKKQVGASEDLVTVLLSPHKQNDGARRKPVALEFDFSPEHIGVRNVEPTSIDAFVQSLPLHTRVAHLLKAGPMTIIAMAKELNAKSDSVTKAVNRGVGKQFVCVPGKDGIDRWALAERRIAS